MKVIAIVRTRNEELNIAPFCQAYQDIADTILVADGGSEDRTLEIAAEFPNVTILHFREQVVGLDNSLWNPEGQHVNFLIDAALDRGADWIIFDDCDCIPNHVLRREGRRLLDHTRRTNPGDQAIFAFRVYFWGRDQIFPALHGGDEWKKPNFEFPPRWTSLWAWQRELPVRADQSDPRSPVLTMTDAGHSLESVRASAHHLLFPYCLLHYSWPTPEIAQAKVDHYRKSGRQPNAQHPLTFGGPLAIPEPFMSPRAPDA